MTLTIWTSTPNFIDIATRVPSPQLREISHFCDFLCMACSSLALSFPFLFLSLHIIFLLTSTGRTGEPIFMVDGSNVAFPPKKVPFRGLIEKIWLYGVSNPQKPPKSGRGLWFPSQTRKFNKNSYLSQIKRYRHKVWTIGCNQKVHIRVRVKGRLSSNTRWRQPPLWEIQTVITQSIFIWFQWNLMSSFVSSSHSQKCNTESDRPLSKWPPPPYWKFKWML
jgi:hypothetical protein